MHLRAKIVAVEVIVAPVIAYLMLRIVAKIGQESEVIIESNSVDIGPLVLSLSIRLSAIDISCTHKYVNLRGGMMSLR